MTETFIRIFLLLAIFAAAFLFIQTSGRLVGERYAATNAVNKRLKLIKTGTHRDRIIGELLKNQPREHAGMPPVLRGMMVGFERTVFGSGIPLSVGQTVMAMAVTIAAILLLTLLGFAVAGREIGFGAVQLAVLFALALGGGLPFLILQRMAAGRRKKIEKQFPVSLDIFVRALRSGHPVASAIDLLTEEMDDPIGSEFGIVSDEVTYGSDLTSALNAMADRWDLEDMRMFVVSLSVQSETGGNLAEILENLSKVIRERASMFMKVRALSSEGRMTGWMLSVLPVFAFVSVFLGSPDFYLDVADDPIFIYGAIGLLVLYLCGVLMIRKMIDLKV